MKIKNIDLSWFRGASDFTSLKLNKKSKVLYGENGSGKSSFVDGMEYIIKDGKILHLTNEYSGRRQEKSIINTHMSADNNAKVVITFTDQSQISAEIEPNGSVQITPPDNMLNKLNYHTIILRQDEISNFIKGSKGDKYSTLLPLLGLGELEISAENLRKLARNIASEANLSGINTDIKNSAQSRNLLFNDQTIDEILNIAKELDKTSDNVEIEIDEDFLSNLGKINKEKINQNGNQNAEYTIIEKISGSDLLQLIQNSKESLSELANSSESLIKEKLDILNSSQNFIQEIVDKEEIDCPACGKLIKVSEFKDHIYSEIIRLEQSMTILQTHRENLNNLVSSIEQLTINFDQESLKKWKENNDLKIEEPFKSLNLNELRNSCTIDQLELISSTFKPIIIAAIESKKDTPQDLQALYDDKNTIEGIKDVLNNEKRIKERDRITTLIDFITGTESEIRNQIRKKSVEIITTISSDISRMWEILHPDEKIEDIKLYLPSDTDKAIEIGLKFYGKELESPRLTLSEGHRNSLGLCIFLSMAKNSNEKDIPIFLDDVIVSFDRNHRGLVAELLEKEFSERQILILTHDREWFIELRHQLENDKWEFETLKPWENPEIGIQFSKNTFSFDDARSKLSNDATSAGNNCRKIMDNCLAVLCEKLEVRMKYKHRERNDVRVASEFLLDLIPDMEKSFLIKESESYIPYLDAVKSMKQSSRLLLSWGNRSSHEYSVIKVEAKKLIDSCEKALNFFECDECNKSVTKFKDTSNNSRRCECGKIKWK